MFNLFYYNSYYHYNSTDGVIKKQTSVVRTNCMDCLDRTNVVQSSLAKWVLTNQLRELNILKSNEELDNSSSFMFLFRNGKWGFIEETEVLTPL